MTPELVELGVKIGVIAPGTEHEYLDPPPRRDLVGEAAARRAMTLAHSGGWPDRLPRSPHSGRPMAPLPNNPMKATVQR
jgi:hypothetical protein